MRTTCGKASPGPDFEKKWKELSKQDLRLVDLETWMDGKTRKWGGVWRHGTDGHYLWVGVDWKAFEAKWKELGKQNLRLIDVEPYVDGGKVKWAGVWREGSDGYYLWVEQWPSFEAKWKELSKQNLRLVDIDTFVEGGVRKWAGVWREGNDGHYLWAGVDWASFTAKWKELAAKDNLRLIDVETYVEGGQAQVGGDLAERERRLLPLVGARRGELPRQVERAREGRPAAAEVRAARGRLRRVRQPRRLARQEDERSGALRLLRDRRSGRAVPLARERRRLRPALGADVRRPAVHAPVQEQVGRLQRHVALQPAARATGTTRWTTRRARTPSRCSPRRPARSSSSAGTTGRATP